MPKAVDISGQTFNWLTAIEATSKRTKYGKVIWRFRCRCGNELECDHKLVTGGQRHSCGCKRHEARPRAQLLGQTFMWLTVIGGLEKHRGRYKWRCQCKCGAIAYASTADLKAERVTSCGCRQAAMRQEQSEPSKSSRPEYVIWQGMKKRCYNDACRSWKSYGGRGIRVCDEWRDSFDAFFRDMGPRPTAQHSLDRIDVNGHYEPSNCRWVLRKQQANNKQSTVRLTLGGKTHTIGEWAEITGIPYRTIALRLKLGWTVERALTQPKRLNRKYERSIRWHTYNTWRSMIGRCHDPEHAGYCQYGLKGISVCERWRESFENFISDMGYRPGREYTLHRIDNYRGYCKLNCRWASAADQMRERISSRLLTFNGNTMTLGEWAKVMGMKASLIAARLDRGWTIDRALTSPPQSVKRFSFGGQDLTAREWAKLLGFSPSAMYYRLQTMPLEKALRPHVL